MPSVCSVLGLDCVGNGPLVHTEQTDVLHDENTNPCTPYSEDLYTRI